MSGIEAWKDTSLASRENWRAARMIERSKAASQVRMARIAHDGDLAAERLGEITHLTANALMAVARVNGVQKQLEAQAPEVSGHLAALTEAHVLLGLEVIEDASRQMRRQ